MCLVAAREPLDPPAAVVSRAVSATYAPVGYSDGPSLMDGSWLGLPILNGISQLCTTRSRVKLGSLYTQVDGEWGALLFHRF